MKHIPSKAHVFINIKSSYNPTVRRQTTLPCLPGDSRSGVWWAPWILPSKWERWSRRGDMGRQLLLWATSCNSPRAAAVPSLCCNTPWHGLANFHHHPRPCLHGYLLWVRASRYSLPSLGWGFLNVDQNSQPRHHFCWENTLEVNGIENTCVFYFFK